MKRVILFGGSFDPIHKEHIKIASEASKILDADVWFLLAKNPRWKSDVTSESDRFNMLSLALKRYKRFSICDIELKSDKDTTYTIDTVYKLKNNYPDTDFCYLIGADQVNKLHDWKDIDELKDLVQFVCAYRKNYEINRENIENYNVLMLDIKGDSTSSTLVRKNLSDNVPKVVLNYINKYKLYLKEDLKELLSERRYIHSVAVANLAKEIAKANKLDERKAYIAGLIHDCSKEIGDKKELSLMKKYAKNHLSEDKNIYHQYTARYIAQEELNIEDEDILDAITYHTTGKDKMSDLAKIIYIADKTEPNRGYDASFFINKAKENLDIGFAYLYLENIEFQKSKGINPFINIDSKNLYKECQKMIEKYQLYLIVKLLDDKAAYDLRIFDLKEHSPLNSYCIICESNSERQAKAYASLIEDEMDKNKFKVHHIEGRKDNHWILIDAFDVIIHVFTKEGRGIYKLDKIWNNLPEISVEDVLNGKF